MKHAFLIMAHHQETLLKTLLKTLDNERVDIFLHIDKKSKINTQALSKCVLKSRLYFADRVCVSWGSFSMVYCEYMLLRKATETGVYKYYHFISGQDFLLKKVDDVLRFYDNSNDCNFISFKDEVECQIDRIRYLYPFQEWVGKKAGILQIIQSCIKRFQEILNISREIPHQIGFGSQFFDMTDDFARFVVHSFSDYQRYFKYTYCADEMFIQTLFLEYKKNHESSLAKVPEKDIGGVDKADAAIQRAIDWKRGSPYVWTISDYQFLIDSGLLYVRKIDEKKSAVLIETLLTIVND